MNHLAVVDGGEIVAALPLFAVRSWLTGNRLVSVPFATFSDPLLSTPEDMGILLDAVLNLSNNIGAKYVEIRITALDSEIADSRFDVSSQYKWTYLPLDCEPNELKKRFSRASIRKPLNQAIRRNLQLRIAEKKSELLTFYKLYIMLRKRLGLPPQPFLYFESLWDEFFHQGNLTLLLALYQDNIIAGHLLFKYKSRVSGEFAAWHQEYQHLRKFKGRTQVLKFRDLNIF